MLRVLGRSSSRSQRYALLMVGLILPMSAALSSPARGQCTVTEWSRGTTAAESRGAPVDSNGHHSERLERWSPGDPCAVIDRAFQSRTDLKENLAFRCTEDENLAQTKGLDRR